MRLALIVLVVIVLTAGSVLVAWPPAGRWAIRQARSSRLLRPWARTWAVTASKLPGGKPASAPRVIRVR
jgi:hypothetical protein